MVSLYHILAFQTHLPYSGVKATIFAAAYRFAIVSHCFVIRIHKALEEPVPLWKYLALQEPVAFRSH